ncbi:MAG TPA: energy transducer TonB [Terriglobales bacterium]|nr:energy transducer TonB [Terriglobales bacterium]
MFVRMLKNLAAIALMALAVGSVIATPARAQDESRRVRSKVAPTYPELAKRMNVSGTVKLQVVVAPNGTVKSAKVIGGHPLLVDPAVDAVKKWRYEPASDETTSVVEFKFDPNVE